MIKNLLILISVFTLLICLPTKNLHSQSCNDLYIAGVLDGPITGGIPKLIHVCANADIADLSIYGVSSANNGNGPTGSPEFDFPVMALNNGDCFTLATETTAFNDFFGCFPNGTDSAASINGDDAIELFCSGTVVDIFGDVNTDGSGTAWDYLDGWAVANDAIPSIIFNAADWTFSGINALDGETSNATASTPYPLLVCPASSCSVDMITAGMQSACDPANNTYSQDITVNYTNPPALGFLDINGQLFAITSSPQTETLTALTADGNSVDVTASFTNDTGCMATANSLYMAPMSCSVPFVPCEITNLIAQNLACNPDGTFNIDICFDYEGPISANVEILFDDISQGLFPYPAISGDCINLNSSFASNGIVFNIEVRDEASAEPTFISEIHYDNTGADVGEFVEVTANGGTDLTGWTLVPYNGSNGTQYSVTPLSGVVTGSGSSCGAASFPISGLQNGSPDGVALVDPAQNVVDFISYEGSFTATNGPAAGMTSMDIGVSEASSEPVGTSLALTDNGWVKLNINSAGFLNEDLSCRQLCTSTITETAPDCCEVLQVNVGPCECIYDPSIGNVSSGIRFSISGGTGPYTVTTSNGMLSNSSPVEGEIVELLLGPGGGAYNVMVTDNMDCVESFSGSCGDCFFDPLNGNSLIDPCSCNNDQSYNGAEDGTFEETVEINGPGGFNLIVGAGSTGMSVPIGTPIPQVEPNLYRIMFDHVDLVGYTIFVEGSANGVTFPILDANGNQLTISNACQYPVITEPPAIDMVAFCNNGAALQFTGDEVTEINGFDGNVSVYVGSQTFGDLVTEFDPTLYANGVYTLTFVFNGDFVSNTGTPANPGFPGCTTSTSIEVGVGGGGALSCNDNVNVTVNNDCELDFSWYTLLEADAIPNVFNAVFTDSAGNIIAEDDLGNYVGSSLTYSIEDLCNGNSCWGTINIEDKSIPTILCDCPVGGEDLDGDGTIDGYSEDCTLSCYELPLLKERYWDNLRDDLVPEDVGDFIDDNVTSVCDDVLESDVSYYDVYEDLGCEGALMRRTWTVNYNKGNGVVGSISCTREYFFQPVGLETIDTARIDPLTGLVVVSEDSIRLPFPLVEMDCGADISPAGIAAYFDDPSSEDQDTDDNNIDPDELDIDCVIESNEGIVYAYPHYYIQGRNPSGPHAQAINTEICNLIVAYVDQEIEACAPGCAGNRKILRNWTVLDWCIGEFIQYGQIIKSVDQGAPIIEVNDISVSVDPWKCSADVMLPHPEHLRDGCDGDLTYWIGFVEGGLTVTGNATDGYVLHDALEGESVTVEYYTEDCCGNRTSTTIEVVVVDLTPPVPVTKEFIVISLINIGNPEDEEQGIAKLFAKDVDNGSYDGCTGVTVEIRRAEVHCLEFDADTLWGDHVKFCCDDLDGQAFVEIDVEFRVTDEYGNVNYAWATVRLEDKSSPTQICPPDMVLTCDMDYNDFTMTGLPQAFSACGEIDLECDPNELIEDTEPRRKGPNDGFFNNPLYDGVEVPAYDPSCGFGAVRRQFASCASCVQWFVIEPIDAFDPSTIVWPSDQTVDCDDFDTGEPSWEESVCNLVGVTLSSDTFLFEDGACFKILNHWSIINWCIYDASNPNGAGRYNHTQLIKIIDTQDPEMMVEDSLCFAVDIDCVSKGVQLSGSATDEGECGSDWLKWEVTIDLNSNWDLDYYYATALPRLVNGVPNPYHIAPTGNGELATITLPDGIASSKVWHRAVWRTYDGCGNNVSTVRYFQITDKKPPTPYCLNLSTAVMSGSGTVELWAIDFNVGSFDNCTAEDNLLFTFTDVAPPARDDSEYDSSSDLMWYNGTFWYYNSETGEYEDQDDYGDEVHRWEPGLRSAGKIFTVADADASGFAQIPIYVWDECGNSDFCLVNLRLIDNMGVGEGRISGQVATETGEEVESVMTELMGASPEYPVYNMTNSAGEYAFYNVPFNTDYEVSGTRTDDYLNGVSTLDLLLIQKHILGTQSLDSPYKMIAADANNDKNISAVDLIELRKLILGIYSELPQNASWKVVDSDQTLTTVNPWIYSESLSIADIQTDMNQEDFIGVKIGDVNNSVKANARGSETTEERGVRIELSYIDTYVKQGEIVEIQMSGNTNEDIYGYQFTMSTSGLELMEVRGEKLDNSNVAVFANAITMSYNDVKPLNNDEIFTLVFKATTEGKVSDIINVNSTITQAEAYVGEELKVVSIDLQGTEEASEFALYQNQPNPFSEYTMIGYDLPQRGDVTLSLYDVTGKMLKVIETTGVKGYNETRVNKSDLSISGLIYYKLETKTHTATRHMLMIE